MFKGYRTAFKTSIEHIADSQLTCVSKASFTKRVYTCADMPTVINTVLNRRGQEKYSVDDSSDSDLDNQSDDYDKPVKRKYT